MSALLSENPYVLEMKSSGYSYENMMTALKDILLETNIYFLKDSIDSKGNKIPGGIRIINMDKSHTILAHLF